MIIQIDEIIRIKGTETCYQLEKNCYRNGCVEWRPFKYYTTFADACGAACEREFRTNPTQGIAEAFEVARRLSQKYGELLDSALAEIAKRATDVDAALQDAA